MTDIDTLERLHQQKQITNLEARVNQLETDFRGVGDLMDQLKRAVLDASERGDLQAGTVKADSSKQILENLITYFEAASRSEG